jgi:hypothetical protein
VNPLFLLPAALLGFLGGKAFSKRKPKSTPLPGVPLALWEKYVAVMVLAPKDRVSPQGKLGTFQMGPRRMVDLGLMTSSQKIDRGGVGMWVGSWKPPLTEDKFLGSMPLQYAAFTRSCKAMAPKVSGLVGVEVDGRKCTLSGLLGVAHMAGEAGCLGWVKDPQVRRKFASTTEVFARTNGIF